MDYDLAGYIDHTLLRPDASEAEITGLCEQAVMYRFASVCVNVCNTSLAAECVKGSGVKVCSVVGFPLGATLTEVKAFETKAAVKAGAREIDMVINVGALKSGKWDYVLYDIWSVVNAAGGNAAVKVILETCLLTDDEIVTACEICVKAGADFVKTSTGFSSGGATVHAVGLMRRAVGEQAGVKASGGIKTREKAIEMIEAGASRIGTSSGAEIVAGEEE